MATPPTLDLGLEAPVRRDLEFVYVGDPMCSWCWGFAPALERLEGHYKIPLRTVMGGLRTGPAADEMDEAARQQLATYWDGVAERTGQPFTHASLQRDGWRYDTEPSCRAVVTMRELAPADTLRWVARLHRAFYVEGVDITDLQVFPDLLEGFDVEPERYRTLLTDPRTRERTQEDFAEAGRYGAAGFPTLLFRDGEELGIVTRGFVDWDALEPALTRWLEERYGPLDTDLLCDPSNGPC
ncbi:MAG: DsbA family protein [Nitriliruptoraceae bacterium]